MSKSKIFYTDTYKGIEEKIKKTLNEDSQSLPHRTINSPRAVGDYVEDMLGENFESILGELSNEYSASFARRAMADIAFTDKDDFYYIVDVKTHRLDSSFNMPNLTSVKRLARFYEDDKNYFVVLKVNYRVKDSKLLFDKVTFVPLEFISWNCLTIGALGWGQIQIANANIVNLLENNSRKEWMIEMCDNLLDYYPKEILKIDQRISYFRGVREFWQSK